MLASILVLSWDVGVIIADRMSADMSMRPLSDFRAAMLSVGLRRISQTDYLALGQGKPLL